MTRKLRQARRVAIVLIVLLSAVGVERSQLLAPGELGAGALAKDRDSAPAAGTSDAGDPANCRRTRRVVRIGLSKTRYPNILRHAREATTLRGYPRVWVLNRRGAEERRERLLRGIPTKPNMDRDEAPAAVGRGQGKGLERGRNPRGWKADVRYVPSAENRGAGASMGIKLRRWCSGTRFVLVGY